MNPVTRARCTLAGACLLTAVGCGPPDAATGPTGTATAEPEIRLLHLNLNDAYIDSPDSLYYEVDSDSDPRGRAVKLSVTLEDNTHADLDQFETWQSILEFTVS